jgi:mannosyltransferase
LDASFVNQLFAKLTKDCHVWRIPGYQFALLSLILAIALCIRCYGFSRTILSSDESFSWRLTEYAPSELIERTALDVHPPLYYLALKAWVFVCGDSPQALRGLSVLFGVLGILMLYALCLEACKKEAGDPNSDRAPVYGGALFSSLIMAIHSSQIVPSHTARMYSLGVLLASSSAWLLLRALRSSAHKEIWWLAYGLVIAAFSYTHYYAILTICAQVIFVVGDIVVRSFHSSIRRNLASIFGLAFAGALLLLLYSPWLPILWQQIHAVRQKYWIPTITSHETELVFLRWASGMDNLKSLGPPILWFAPLVGLALWRLIYGDRAACFFVIQAIVPWVISLGISVWSGRPIFVERYMAFAHISLLVLWGVIWCRLHSTALRAFLVFWVGLPCLFGVGETLEQVPGEPPAIAKAAAVLKQQYKPGDVVLVDVPSNLNLLRYYTRQAGMQTLSVRCFANASEKDGHQTHIASLPADDLLWPHEMASITSHMRLWLAFDRNSYVQFPIDGMKAQFEETFDGGGKTRYTLLLYAKTDAKSGSTPEE